MDFRPTKWKVIASILVFLLEGFYIHFISADNDSNLLVNLAPAILVYLVWSLFEKKR